MEEGGESEFIIRKRSLYKCYQLVVLDDFEL